MSARQHAFTLVEILIVVVILGILAAVIVPMFNRSVDEAASNATHWELQKLRRQVGVYRARNQGEFPAVAEGAGTWGELVNNRDYMMAEPINAWVGGGSAKLIVFGAQADSGYQTDYGWIYDPDTGNVWAGGFDANDEPYPRN